jgi:hypothetical protein
MCPFRLKKTKRPKTAPYSVDTHQPSLSTKRIFLKGRETHTGWKAIALTG